MWGAWSFYLGGGGDLVHPERKNEKSSAPERGGAFWKNPNSLPVGRGLP